MNARAISMQGSDTRWTCFNNKIPKEELIYFSQVTLIFIVVIACITNLSLGNEHETVWISLLCSSLGYILPAPTLKERKRNEPLAQQ